MKINLMILFMIALTITPAMGQSPPPPGITIGDKPSTARGRYSNESSPFYFNIATGHRKSYCCEAVASNTRTIISSLSNNGVGSTFPPIYNRGHYEPVITEGYNPGVAQRVCFTSESPTSHTVKVEIPSDSDAEVFETLEAQCSETTLYGGFNTAAVEINFLEITNRSGKAVNVHIRGYSEMSNEGNEVINLQFEIPGSNTRPITRKDIDIHSLVGKGDFGAILITHDAPKGSINAIVSKYKITSTTPFDYTLVGRRPFETRD